MPTPIRQWPIGGDNPCFQQLLPFWDGRSAAYPSVKLRMDFSNLRIVGTFVYHCHLLEHGNGGMMGTIAEVPIGN